MNNTNPAEKRIPAFCNALAKAEDEDNTPEAFIDQFSQDVLELPRRWSCRRPTTSCGLGHVYRNKSGGQPVRPFLRLNH
jgi:hypothetical protein